MPCILTPSFLRLLHVYTSRRERESAEKFRSQQQPRQPRPQTARSNTSTNVSGRRVGSLPTIKADRPRPQSASMYKSSSISISSSNKDFSELFASTLEWPRPRTLPRAASHPPPSSSAPVTDGFISASGTSHFVCSLHSLLLPSFLCPYATANSFTRGYGWRRHLASRYHP
jgi:hypothetical protein